MNLFQLGEFVLAAGQTSEFKLDCDALSDEDVATCAHLLAKRLPPFKSVEGVPQGGLRLAEALREHSLESAHSVIIADDVFTTGYSIQKLVKLHQMQSRYYWQAGVIFARTALYPRWVTPLFVMTPTMHSDNV